MYLVQLTDLRRELKSKNLDYWFDTTKYKNIIDLKIRYKDGYFHLHSQRKTYQQLS